MSSRLSWGPVVVLALAALTRLPHYDAAWFGYDQTKYAFEARQILSGHWDVIGPDAAGLDIIGPLYSYLIAAILWVCGDVRALVLFGVACDAAACWFVYDAARRLSGPAAGVAAGVTYAAMPAAVLGTRLLWNPTLLPALTAVGWWLVVRYGERPSTFRLVAVALAAGLTLPLHATGVFQGLGFVLAVFVARMPSLPQLAAGAVAGLLPLAPVIPRWFGGAHAMGGLAGRIALPHDPIALYRRLADVTLDFPLAPAAHWSGSLSAAVLHVQLLVAAVGLVAGLVRPGRHRAVWLGLALSLALQMTAAAFYTSPIAWYYFLALLPAAALWAGNATTLVPAWRAPAWAAAALAATHVAFLVHFDRETAASGLVQVRMDHLVAGAPRDVGSSPTVGYQHQVERIIATVVPDGATAMYGAHGARGELWRETSAQFLPAAAAPRDDMQQELQLVGPAAKPIRTDARLIGRRVCTFPGSAIAWRADEGIPPPPPGWEQLGFDDGRWAVVRLPRRVGGPSHAVPPTTLASWSSPIMALRGRFTVDDPAARRALSVTMRSPGNVPHRLTRVTVNGIALTPKDRWFFSPVSLIHEWFIDLAGRLRPGDNLVTLTIEGDPPIFDLDVFDVPCLDGEWYY